MSRGSCWHVQTRSKVARHIDICLSEELAHACPQANCKQWGSAMIVIRVAVERRDSNAWCVLCRRVSAVQKCAAAEAATSYS